jgi:hypothetical protein
MADSGPDLRPDRRRLTQRGWWAPVAQCHIRGSGATGLKDKVRHCCLSYRLHCPNPSRSRGRHCRRHHCTASSSPPLDLPDLDVDAMADSNTSKSTGQLSLSPSIHSCSWSDLCAINQIEKTSPTDLHIRHLSDSTSFYIGTGAMLVYRSRWEKKKTDLIRIRNQNVDSIGSDQERRGSDFESGQRKP